MAIEKDDQYKKTLEMFVASWNKIKKKITNKDFKKKLDKFFEKNLESPNTTTYYDLAKSLERDFGADVRDFFMSLLISPEDVIKELKRGGVGEDKYLMYIHNKYFKLVQEAKSIYDYPERWRLLNTDLIQSKNRGFIFRTRITRYDNKLFYFESLPDDYFILLDHFLARIGEVTAKPLDEFIKKLDNLKGIIEKTKQDTIKKGEEIPKKQQKK